MNQGERPEKIGIFLTEKFNPNYPRSDKNTTPRYPNLEGKFRCLAVTYALKLGLVDNVFILGGMKDNTGTPVEIGHFNYLQLLLRNTLLAKRVAVFPRNTDSIETIGDMTGVKDELARLSQNSTLVFISSRWHLSPRFPLIMKLAGTTGERLPVEDIFSQMMNGKFSKHTRKMQIPDKIIPLRYRFKMFCREMLLSGVMLPDLVPGVPKIGSKVIELVARKQRKFS